MTTVTVGRCEQFYCRCRREGYDAGRATC